MHTRKFFFHDNCLWTSFIHTRQLSSGSSTHVCGVSQYHGHRWNQGAAQNIRERWPRTNTRVEHTWCWYLEVRAFWSFEGKPSPLLVFLQYARSSCVPIRKTWSYGWRSWLYKRGMNVIVVNGQTRGLSHSVTLWTRESLYGDLSRYPSEARAIVPSSFFGLGHRASTWPSRQVRVTSKPSQQPQEEYYSCLLAKLEPPALP